MDFRYAGAAVQKQRKLKGMTQEELGERVDLTSNTISRIERGLLLPTIQTLINLCNALDCGADTILAAYIAADAPIRWSPLAEQLAALPTEKQDKIERILNCLIETL
ncbi:MAG: helix-turn-helix transcriptional regulator [Butyricicoccus sp.]|nr:helix-turn-helix transcriptional regulator [Butyricicoccus sp.]